jgi:pectin methylesterase-like acyl-CoA thioesterase
MAGIIPNMKKITSLVSICFIFLFVITSSVYATEITVCSSGCDYTIIQNAIGNASSVDIINVSAGTYDELVIIDKSLTIQGTGDTTVIKPSSATIFSQIFTGLPTLIF